MRISSKFVHVKKSPNQIQYKRNRKYIEAEFDNKPVQSLKQKIC